jgi:hypothetical protein
VYLRLLLHNVAGATSFVDLRTTDRGTPNPTIHPTFKAACGALGLLEDDSEWQQCITEAATQQSGRHLRELFVTILLFNSPSDPLALWTAHLHHFTDDFPGHPDAVNMALRDLARLLQPHNKDLLRDFGLPRPTAAINQPMLVAAEVAKASGNKCTYAARREQWACNMDPKCVLCHQDDQI